MLVALFTYIRHSYPFESSNSLAYQLLFTPPATEDENRTAPLTKAQMKQFNGFIVKAKSLEKSEDRKAQTEAIALVRLTAVSSYCKRSFANITTNLYFAVQSCNNSPQYESAFEVVKHDELNSKKYIKMVRKKLKNLRLKVKKMTTVSALPHPKPVCVEPRAVSSSSAHNADDDDDIGGLVVAAAVISITAGTPAGASASSGMAEGDSKVTAKLYSHYRSIFSSLSLLHSTHRLHSALTG